MRRKNEEYIKYSNLALRNYSVSQEDFDFYINCAKTIFGKKASPKDAYYIIEEEWYDEHYK